MEITTGMLNVLFPCGLNLFISMKINP